MFRDTSILGLVTSLFRLALDFVLGPDIFPEKIEKCRFSCKASRILDMRDNKLSFQINLSSIFNPVEQCSIVFQWWLAVHTRWTKATWKYQGENSPALLLMRTNEGFVSLCSSSAAKFRACALTNYFQQKGLAKATQSSSVHHCKRLLVSHLFFLCECAFPPRSCTAIPTVLPSQE